MKASFVSAASSGGGDDSSPQQQTPNDNPSFRKATPLRTGPSLAERALCISADGRIYEDFYWPVIEDLVLTPGVSGATAGADPSSAGSAPEWHKIVRVLKRAFNEFPSRANWGIVTSAATSVMASKHAASVPKGLELSHPSTSAIAPTNHDRGTTAGGSGSGSGSGASGSGDSPAIMSPSSVQAAVATSAASAAATFGQGSPSSAAGGNLLEAINLALNVFAAHHVDRDLARMGQDVVVLTAGCGVWNVDPALAQVTKQARQICVCLYGKDYVYVLDIFCSA
jgi:hypothetical protein